MASIEERFQAAVNVIKNLPKNGPYQPSTTMMLKFYGYYKQATEGPCHQKKPGFWDVVGKAKWDAWNSNKHLTKQQAMQKYVEELREIIETMSFTENVQNFVGSLSGLDNIDLDDLEMIAPGMREVAESHPNSPFHSRTNSTQHGVSSNNNNNVSNEAEPLKMNGHVTNYMNGHLNGNGTDTNDGSIIPPTPTTNMQTSPLVAPTATYAVDSSVLSTLNTSVEQSDDEYVDPVDIHNDITEAIMQNSELLKQIQATVLRMNADMIAVNQRMATLERTVQEMRSQVQRSKQPFGGNGGSNKNRKYPSWWPFDNISPVWFVLLILWPFVVRRAMRMLVPANNKRY